MCEVRACPTIRALDVTPLPGASLRPLMERLVAATEASRLQWTKSGEEIYLTNVSGFSITISSTDGDGHPPYRLSILDDQAIELTGVDWKVDRTPYGSLADSEQ